MTNSAPLVTIDVTPTAPADDSLSEPRPLKRLCVRAEPVSARASFTDCIVFPLVLDLDVIQAHRSTTKTMNITCELELPRGAPATFVMSFFYDTDVPSTTEEYLIRRMAACYVKSLRRGHVIVSESGNVTQTEALARDTFPGHLHQLTAAFPQRVVRAIPAGVRRATLWIALEIEWASCPVLCDSIGSHLWQSIESGDGCDLVVALMDNESMGVPSFLMNSLLPAWKAMSLSMVGSRSPSKLSGIVDLSKTCTLRAFRLWLESVVRSQAPDLSNAETRPTLADIGGLLDVNEQFSLIPDEKTEIKRVASYEIICKTVRLHLVQYAGSGTIQQLEVEDFVKARVAALPMLQAVLDRLTENQTRLATMTDV